MTPADLRASDLRCPGADRPDPRAGLFACPSPEIGEVLCAWSDVAPDGSPRLEPFSRKSDGRVSWLSPLLGAFFGLVLCGGAGIGIISGFDELVPSDLRDTVVFSLAGFGLVAGGLLTWLLARWIARFEPECIYVGTRGVERFQQFGGRLRHTRALYAGAAHALHMQTQYTRGGAVAEVLETLWLLDAAGASLFTVGTRRPSVAAVTLQTELVRAIAQAHARARAGELHGRVAAGERVRFPVYEESRPGFRESGRALELGGGAIALVEPNGARRQTALATARIGVRNGALRIEDAAGAGVVAEVERNTLGDFAALAELLGASGVRLAA